MEEKKMKTKDITERIKTFEDACNELGQDHELVKQYEAVSACGDITDVVAYMKLRIIAAALNEGWQPKMDGVEWRYYPYFWLYSKKEYDRMSEEERSRVVLRSGYYSCTSGGVAYANASYDSSGTNSGSGSRLAFKTRTLAMHAGKQFIDIWADYLFG